MYNGTVTVENSLTVPDIEYEPTTSLLGTCVCVCVCVCTCLCVSHSVVSDSLQPHRM